MQIANSEDEIELTEKPFVSKILLTNNVYYFRGLFMKVWADNPFLYKTQQVNKNWTFSYGRGVTQLSDGQDRFDVINMEWDGRTDEDGYRFYEFPSVYVDGQEGVGMWVKKGNVADQVLIKIADESGGTTTQEMSSYMVDESMSNDEYTYYYIFKINEPGRGYVDVIDTIGPCEGKKVYLHDEYFMLDGDTAPSAVTKLEFSKEIREIPVGSFVRFYRLSDVILPAKLTQLGANTFTYCVGLSAMTIPSNVTFIDTSAFDYCNNLTDIYFDNSVTMLPAGAPWGATNAIVRCRDGYYEGEIRYLYNKSGSEGNQYYRRCWGLDIVDAPNKGTLYAFVKQSEYDAYHNDYLVSTSQGSLWSGNTEGALSHVSEICYVNEISGKTGSVMVAVPSVSGGTPVLDMPDGSVYVPVSIEDGVLACPFGTFQHYDFLDYTDKNNGVTTQLYGFCNRIGYTKYQNESDAVFHERIVAGIEKDLGDGGYDNEDVSDIPFKMYLFNRQDDCTGYDFTYSATTSWLNGDIVSRLNKPSVNLPTYKILSSTTFVPGNVIVGDYRGWLPTVYSRFAPLDIVVGNKTYYAFWLTDFIDQYHQAGYGDTFDGHCISGLSFEVESTYQTPGFSGSTVNVLNGSLLYTDTLNANVAYWNSGDLAFSSDLENVGYSFGYRTGCEYITISGGNVVSALCFMDETDNGTPFTRSSSGDVVVDDITYYCFESGDNSWYLTDISEGRKFRFYTTTPSGFSDNFVSFEDYGLEFLASYSGLPNVTANSGNTISYTMVDDGTSFVFNYFEPYNVVIGNTTFYAYILHGAYATAYRILSNAESGITSGLDTRLYTAIYNENGNSELISNGKMQVLFMTDISQGVKGGIYMALMDVYQSNPNSYDGQIRLREKMYADMAEYDGEITCQITNNPDLDSDIEDEIASANNSGNNNSEPEDPGYEEPIEDEGPTELRRGDIQNPSELREYIMPDSIQEVAEHAFSGCTNVTYLYIGSGFTDSGDYGFEAMADLVNLESIEVSPSNYMYKSPNNCNAVLDRNYGSDLLLGCKNTVIPNTVKTVGGFKNTSGLTSITLPDSVTTIGYEAFMNCKDLSAITLSSNLEWIREKAFYGCSNLRQIILPESVTEINDYAFEGCTSLTQIIIPENVTVLGYHAFYGCSNLTDIQIDNSEDNVNADFYPDDAFVNCGTNNIRYLKDEEYEI